MNILLDANMPRSALDVFAEFHHVAMHVRDIGMADATDEVISQWVRHNQYAFVTRDLDFSNVHHYPPSDYHGLIVLRLPETAIASTINSLLRELLSQGPIIQSLPGHLAIVEFGRVRMR